MELCVLYIFNYLTNSVISSVCSQVSVSAALQIPTRKRKHLTEAELELRRQKRKEAAAKRAKMQEDLKKKQQEQKYKKK